MKWMKSLLGIILLTSAISAIPSPTLAQSLRSADTLAANALIVPGAARFWGIYIIPGAATNVTVTLYDQGVVNTASGDKVFPTTATNAKLWYMLPKGVATTNGLALILSGTGNCTVYYSSR